MSLSFESGDVLEAPQMMSLLSKKRVIDGGETNACSGQCSGADGATTASTATFTSSTATFVTDGVAYGDILSIEEGADEGLHFISTVDSETELTVISVFTSTATNLDFSIGTAVKCVGGSYTEDKKRIAFVGELPWAVLPDPAHDTLYRKDLIVYRPSLADFYVIKGSNHTGGSSDPIYPPDMLEDDLLLAIIDIDAGEEFISSSAIHDARITGSREYFRSIASDDLRESDDASSSTTATSYTTVKTITIPSDFSTGELRIKFYLACDGSMGWARAKIYQNAGAVGTERQVGHGSNIQFSEDISDWLANDDIVIKAYRGGGSSSASVSNFRIYHSADLYLNGAVLSLDSYSYTW